MTLCLGGCEKNVGDEISRFLGEVAGFDVCLRYAKKIKLQRYGDFPCVFCFELNSSAAQLLLRWSHNSEPPTKEYEENRFNSSTRSLQGWSLMQSIMSWMSQVKSIHLVVSTKNILTYRCVSPTVVVILLSMGLFVIHREILHKDLKSSRGVKHNKNENVKHMRERKKEQSNVRRSDNVSGEERTFAGHKLESNYKSHLYKQPVALAFVFSLLIARATVSFFSSSRVLLLHDRESSSTLCTRLIYMWVPTVWRACRFKMRGRHRVINYGI